MTEVDFVGDRSGC